MTLTTQTMIENLSPAELGCIAATLDDCSSMGDDDTVDALQKNIHENVTRDWFEAGRIAYFIVHVLARDISN